MQLKKYILHLKCNVMKAVGHFMVPINSQASSAQTTKNLLYFGNRNGPLCLGIKAVNHILLLFSTANFKESWFQQQWFEAAITKREKG